MDSVSSLVEVMGQCRALDAGQLDEVRRQILPGFVNDARGLAGALLKRQWLTPFQINRLVAGRGMELLLGNYVLLERIGEGGMGQVFKARNWKLGKIVALKLIRKELLTNKTVVGRFEREVATTALLDHPNIIRAYDADRIGDGLFIVMEYVEGIDLSRLVKEQGPVAAPRACEFMRQAALGLQHAYEKGMVHRDIKPPNLLLDTQSEVVKILDMGLARAQETPELLDQMNQPALTQLGVIVGTVDFIAPEQARDSSSVDIRADLYALGCTFHYLLTGKVPFPGGTPTEKLIKHTLDPLPSMLTIPPPLRAILVKLMAKKPAERYQTPIELVVALEQVLAHPEKMQMHYSSDMLPATIPTMQLAVREMEGRGRELVGVSPVPEGSLATAKASSSRRISGAQPRLPELGDRPATNRPTPPPRPAVALALEEFPRAIPVAAVAPPPPPPVASRRKKRSLWFVAAGCLIAGAISISLMIPAPKTQGDSSRSRESGKPEPEPNNRWDGVVREFLVLGPFGRDVTIPVEVLENPGTEAIFEGPLASRFRWKPQKVEGQGALRVPSGGERKPATLFATVQVHSPSQRKVKLLLGSADAIRVWVNGKSLLESGKPYPQPRPDEHKLDVTLKPGWNQIMVKLGARGQRAFEFYLSVQGEDGLRAALKADN